MYFFHLRHTSSRKITKIYKVQQTNHSDSKAHGGAMIIIISNTIYQEYPQETIVIIQENTTISIYSAYSPRKNNIKKKNTPAIFQGRRNHQT